MVGKDSHISLYLQKLNMRGGDDGDDIEDDDEGDDDDDDNMVDSANKGRLCSLSPPIFILGMNILTRAFSGRVGC
jgi:hypothetical protein